MTFSYFVAAGFFRRNARSEGAAEGGFKGGIPPRPSVPPERSGGGQFFSKKFRAKFRISHQSQLSPFWGRVASRLRRSAFGFCALRKAQKSHGGKKEKEIDFIFCI
jgi:hypothetical protein